MNPSTLLLLLASLRFSIIKLLDCRTIRNGLKDSVLIEGVHYIRPFGGREILYLWEKIEKDTARPVSIDSLMLDTRKKMIPLLWQAEATAT